MSDFGSVCPAGHLSKDKQLDGNIAGPEKVVTFCPLSITGKIIADISLYKTQDLRLST